jgi:hypothetical protein
VVLNVTSSLKGLVSTKGTRPKSSEVLVFLLNTMPMGGMVMHNLFPWYKIQLVIATPDINTTCSYADSWAGGDWLMLASNESDTKKTFCLTSAAG